MNTIHFMKYTTWKQTTHVLIIALLISLTATYGLFYYQKIVIQKKFKSACLIDPAAEPYSSQETMRSCIQEIDKHELYRLFNALVEVMPPYVKIEKFDYAQTESNITLKADNHTAMARMLEASAKNNALKTFTLKSSSQEKDTLVFVVHRVA